MQVSPKGWACFQRQQQQQTAAVVDGIFGELVEFRCAAQSAELTHVAGFARKFPLMLGGHTQVVGACSQIMLVVVVDFLEDGGLSRCVVCWWI